MAKYCLYFSMPRYDNRDAIVGTHVARGQCFTKLRTAKKALRRELKNAHDELHVDLCAGPRFCDNGRDWKKAVPLRKRSAKGIFKPTRHVRQKPSTAKQRRAKRRERLDPNYIPF